MKFLEILSREIDFDLAKKILMKAKGRAGKKELEEITHNEWRELLGKMSYSCDRRSVCMWLTKTAKTYEEYKYAHVRSGDENYDEKWDIYNEHKTPALIGMFEKITTFEQCENFFFLLKRHFFYVHDKLKNNNKKKELIVDELEKLRLVTFKRLIVLASKFSDWKILYKMSIGHGGVNHEDIETAEELKLKEKSLVKMAETAKELGDLEYVFGILPEGQKKQDIFKKMCKLVAQE